MNMKNISIDEPCNENWNEMSPTQRGAFCQKCSIDVIDFTQKTPDQIKAILRENKGKHLCGHFGVKQLDLLNGNDYSLWQGQTARTFQSKFVYALIMVFGMTLFSCSQKEANFIADLNRSKTEINLDMESLSSVDDFASTVQSAQIAKHLSAMDIQSASKEMLWEEQIDGGIGWDARWAETDEIREANYSDNLLGAVSYTRVLEAELCAVEEEPESLLPIEILNETNRFETKLFPNPTRDRATLVVFVKEAAQFDIQLYNMSGQMILEIHRGELQDGEQRFDIEMYDFTPGMYLARIVSVEQTETVKIQRL
ncbi:T9SS type A sorting domain-containing protein [Crocinitomix catalasitica]|nr:T9SS type A sorting domain-containing protein [Crocinitomix catalasitica]